MKLWISETNLTDSLTSKIFELYSDKLKKPNLLNTLEIAVKGVGEV